MGYETNIRLFGQTTFFRYAQVSMIICGIWPLQTENYWLRSLYQVYRVFIRLELICSLLICGPVTVPYAFSVDKTLFSETLSYEIQYTTLLLKVWMFESKAARELLKESLDTERRIHSTRDPFQLSILERNRKITVKLSFIYSIMICSAFAFFCHDFVYQTEMNWEKLKQTFNEDIVAEAVKRQPIVFTLPYLSGNWFYVGMISQTFGVICVIIYSIATQSMFFAYIYFTVVQIQVLKNALRNFENDLEKCRKNISGRDTTLQLLEQNIIFHQKLVKYVRTLDGVLKYAILFDFFFYSLQIGATVSKILSEIQNNEYQAVLFHANYLCFNYLGLHFNFRSAHEIIFESSSLSMSIYESKWYKQDVKIQRSYLMMMMQMKYPLCLHVGPLYAVSNELLILIIKTAYSFVTLLSKSS